mmetsp:Transcript_91333/g.217795  ORF Transcript_91333/g.217795 Transcript_91333/m.217795 type:complete len:291 (-) Transcript_91333:1285-2157(-)
MGGLLRGHADGAGHSRGGWPWLFPGKLRQCGFGAGRQLQRGQLGLLLLFPGQLRLETARRWNQYAVPDPCSRRYGKAGALQCLQPAAGLSPQLRECVLRLPVRHHGKLPLGRCESGVRDRKRRCDLQLLRLAGQMPSGTAKGGGVWAQHHLCASAVRALVYYRDQLQPAAGAALRPGRRELRVRRRRPGPRAECFDSDQLFGAGRCLLRRRVQADVGVWQGEDPRAHELHAGGERRGGGELGRPAIEAGGLRGLLLQAEGLHPPRGGCLLPRQRRWQRADQDKVPDHHLQ